MSLLGRLEQGILDRAEGLRLRPCTVVAKNANGSYQVLVDGARHYQVYSQNAIDYAPGLAAGDLAIPVNGQIVLDGFGRATLIP